MSNLQPSLRQFEANGTVFGAINKEQFQNLAVIDSSDAVVRAFEKAVSVIDDEIELLTSEVDALSEVRDALLPRLLSGELAATSSKPA